MKRVSRHFCFWPLKKVFLFLILLNFLFVIVLIQKKKPQNVVKLSEPTESLTSLVIPPPCGNFRENFTYILEPKPKVKICSGGCKKPEDLLWKMFLFVKSAAENPPKRQKIRKTWGAITQVDGASFSVVFVIGFSSSEKINQMIKEEHALFGDILQYRGADDYRSIGVKTLAGMQWAADHLPDQAFYSTVDDDFHVYSKALAYNINLYLKKKVKRDWAEFPILCGFVRGEKEEPVRPGDEQFVKWAISKDLYKWSVYPPYCHGGIYSTSVRVIKQLFYLSRSERVWHLDDVWITGILRWKLGMPDDQVVAPSLYYGIHEHEESLYDFVGNRKLMIFNNLLYMFSGGEVCHCSLQ